MSKLNCDIGKIPMENALCLFKLRTTARWEIDFIIGSLIYDKSKSKYLIKELNKQDEHECNLFSSFQNIISTQGGHYFVNQKN